MTKVIVDQLKEGSSFCDDDYFKYTVIRVYKYSDKVNGVQVSYSWKNAFGIFCERKYISREELLSSYYDDEFVQI